MRLGERAASDAPIYNVGTGVGTAFIDMARSIVAIAGAAGSNWSEWPPLAEQIETGDFVADISRISKDIGWTPAVSASRRPRAHRVVLSRARRVMTSARIRVVYLAHTFQVGGAEEMVLNLVRHLPARFEPMVCCIHELGPIGAEIRDSGTPVSVLGLNPGLRRPWDVARIRRYLRERAAADRAHVPADGQPLRSPCRDARARANRDRHRSEHLRAKTPEPCAGRTAAHARHRPGRRLCRVGSAVLHPVRCTPIPRRSTSSTTPSIGRSCRRRRREKRCADR